MKLDRFFVLVLLVLQGLFVCSCGRNMDKPKVVWAGCRSSEYGITKNYETKEIYPFPDAEDWCGYVDKMVANYPSSNGALVWIVTTMNGKHSCKANFPLSKPLDNFVGIRRDENEAYLKEFDKKGYSVWLQVESADADICELAEEILNRYKHHPCVKGFGVDVEWYFPNGPEAPYRGKGTKFGDEIAEKLDKTVKAINPEYNVFVKHWDFEWLPPEYRSDMIFVNDSQMFESLEQFQDEFSAWTRYYEGNPVFFRIGYNSDKWLWGKFKNPAKDLGKYICEGIDCKADVGIIWVDFTLRQVLDK